MTVPEGAGTTLMGKFSFTRQERLSKEKWIKELFEKGSSFNLYPFRVLFLPHPDPEIPTSQILITVSVRNFKKAIDRNLLKRRIREAYRLNKQLLNTDLKLLIAYIYTAREKVEYEKIRSGMEGSLDSISRKKIQKMPKDSPGK